MDPKAQQLQESWPTEHDAYELLGKIGYGAFATVWRAHSKIKTTTKKNDDGIDSESTAMTKTGPLCAIKIINLEHIDTNFVDIRLEVQTMRLSSHPNVLNCHTSFVYEATLWLVTEFMSKGSSLRCLQAAAKIQKLKDAQGEIESNYNQNIVLCEEEESGERGMFEHHITYILHETLLGLKYIHENLGQIHRDVKGGNILLGGDGSVVVADFGVSGWLINSGMQRENTKTFVGTPCWMAPEVMEQIHGYDYKADIWSLGITALELAKGYAPYAKYPPMKVLLMTIQEDPPSLDSYHDDDDRKWSRSFRDVIRLCLQKNPKNRPTCEQLLSHRHFKKFSSDPNFRDSTRLQIKEEILDLIDNVGNNTTQVGSKTHHSNDADGGGDVLSSESMYETICIAERPAGTTWIFNDGSQVLASSTVMGKSSASGRVVTVETDDDDDKEAFFDEFERQTQGENFSSVANVVAKEEDEKLREQELQQKEREELDEFFDEFEKSTQGENFKRTT